MYERCEEVNKRNGKRCLLDDGHRYFQFGGQDLHSTNVKPSSPFRVIERARMDGRKLPNARHHRWCVLALDHIGKCKSPEAIKRQQEPVHDSGPTKQFYATTTNEIPAGYATRINFTDMARALLGLPERENYSGEKTSTIPTGIYVWPNQPPTGLWKCVWDNQYMDERRTHRPGLFGVDYKVNAQELLAFPYGKEAQKRHHIKLVLAALLKTLDAESIKKLETELVTIVRDELTRVEDKARLAAELSHIPVKYKWSFGVVQPSQTPSTDGTVVGTDGLLYKLPSAVGYCSTRWYTVEPHLRLWNCEQWKPEETTAKF